MKKEREREILMLLGYYDYQLHMGIVRYAKKAGWVLDFYHDMRTLPYDWEGDGIIAFITEDKELKDFINTKKVPVVDFGWQNPDYPKVWNDDKAIGRSGAEYLISRGYRNIGFVYVKGPAPEMNNRIKGFVETCEEHKVTSILLDLLALENKLKQLPKPIAFILADDSYSSKILRLCRKLDIAVPEEISLLGIDNDMYYCELARVPLSSIDSDLEGRGYAAAELLDRIIDGETPSKTPLLIPPKGIIERQSTNILAVPHRKTALALKYIWDNFSDFELTVDKIVERSGMCRSRLDELFNEHLGHSIFNEILRLRLEKAKKLLLETDLKISEISDECGFSGLKHLRRAFKRKFGIGPRGFKK